MPASERESGEEEWEDEVERERETTVLTAEIETCEKKSFGLNRGHTWYQRRKSIWDRMTEQRDVTHRGGTLGSPSRRKERIEFLPAFFRIVVIVEFSIKS